MFVLRSLGRILLFVRFILTSLAVKGCFAERLAPATWKRGCHLLKTAENVSIGLLNMQNSVYMNSFLC